MDRNDHKMITAIEKYQDACVFFAKNYQFNDVVEARMIWPRDVPGGGKPHSIWFYAKDISRHIETLAAKNEHGYGIYVGANPRKGFGLRGDTNVALARNMFCDFDDIQPGDGCGRYEFLCWRLDEAKIPHPDMVIHTGGGLHAYWHLTEPLTDLAKWSKLQVGLIAKLKSDPSIKNPERVMRLPGFINTKPTHYSETFIIHGGRDAY